MRPSRETSIFLLFSAITVFIDTVVVIKLEELPADPDSLSLNFVVVLATISALIFTIPLFFRSSGEGTIDPKRDDKHVAVYLCAFILGIFVSLFAIFLKDSQMKFLFFKLSIIFFLDCLIWLIPYLLVFLRRDTIKVMKGVRNSILDELKHIPSGGKKDRKEILKEKMNDLTRITLQALSNHNYIALDYGISCLMDVNCEIMRKTRMTTEIGNILIKEMMRSFRDLSVACIECKSDEYSRRIGKHMKEIIMDGLRNGKNFEYPNLVLNIEKLGIGAARKHLEETTDEILNSLGKIGDQGIKKRDLQRSPILAVLKSLQDIGIICTEEKMVHQCATARTRLIGAARLGDNLVRDEALRRFWVITAFMYTNIPEMKETSYELETRLKEEFGRIFTQQIDETIEMLHKESDWIKKQVVREFKNTSEFLKEY